MQSLSRGWSFLTEAWKMALADKDLIKPSVFALLAGFVVSLIYGYLTDGDGRMDKAGVPAQVAARRPLAAVLGN